MRIEERGEKMKKIIYGFIIFLLLLSINFFNFGVITNAEENKHKEEKSSNQLIIVNKSYNKMAFYDDHRLIKEFSVATGKSIDLTPEGIFEVIRKEKNVPYYKLKIPGGAPNNPLGPRWIGLNVHGTNGMLYGIHGNAAPWSIGTYASKGCVRMYNNEVIWLWDKVELGTPVIILRDTATFDEIAERNRYEVKKPLEISKDITLLDETEIFSVPHDYGKTNKTLDNEKELKAILTVDDWLKVTDKKKEYWIKINALAFGKIKKENKYLYLKGKEITYDYPLEKEEKEEKIKYIIIKSFQEVNGWYFVENGKNKTWIKPYNYQVLENEEIIKTKEKFKETIENKKIISVTKNIILFYTANKIGG